MDATTTVVHESGDRLAALIRGQIAVVEEVGPWDKRTADYMIPVCNNAIWSGRRCGNCRHYAAGARDEDGTCAIVSGTIHALGYCRLAAIPDEALAEMMTEHGEQTDGLFELRDVEIFRAGKWKGETYTDKDLQDIVDAFDKVGFQPALKLGHREESGDRAYGWVRSLRLVGDRLLADIADMPRRVYEAIKERAYDHVSSEIFFNLDRGGQKFRRVLKAVALLGAEVPGVAGLRPLREASFTDTGVDVRSIPLETADMPNDSMPTALTQLQEQIVQLTRQSEESRAAQERTIAELTARLTESEGKRGLLSEEVVRLADTERRRAVDARAALCRVPALMPAVRALYDAASVASLTVKFGDKDDAPLSAVVDALVGQINDAAARLFKQVALAPSTPPPGEGDPDLREPAATVIDRRARKYMAENKTDNYKAAFDAVLAADPELKLRYAAE